MDLPMNNSYSYYSPSRSSDKKSICFSYSDRMLKSPVSPGDFSIEDNKALFGFSFSDLTHDDTGLLSFARQESMSKEIQRLSNLRRTLGGHGLESDDETDDSDDNHKEAHAEQAQVVVASNASNQDLILAKATATATATAAAAAAASRTSSATTTATTTTSQTTTNSSIEGEHWSATHLLRKPQRSPTSSPSSALTNKKYRRKSNDRWLGSPIGCTKDVTASPTKPVRKQYLSSARLRSAIVPPSVLSDAGERSSARRRSPPQRDGAVLVDGDDDSTDQCRHRRHRHHRRLGGVDSDYRRRSTRSGSSNKNPPLRLLLLRQQSSSSTLSCSSSNTHAFDDGDLHSLTSPPMIRRQRRQQQQPRRRPNLSPQSSLQSLSSISFSECSSRSELTMSESTSVPSSRRHYRHPPRNDCRESSQEPSTHRHRRPSQEGDDSIPLRPRRFRSPVRSRQ